jgi:ubiquinone/menaquinone biosynthesis C-methylase UbiE
MISPPDHNIRNSPLRARCAAPRSDYHQAMLFRFRKMRAMDPLQVAMTGVRMGERYLQVFCSDPALTRGLATKTGLSGVAALAAPDDQHARQGQKAAEKAGVLIDIKHTAVTSLTWDDAMFDMVVVDNTGGAFGRLTDADQSACLRDARRVLRDGGRIEFIERESARSGADALLTAAGFKPVRTLAERDGFRFVEGLKG